MITSLEYVATAESLCQHILSLIPDHPEILEMDDANDLHKIEAFKCESVSIYQAAWALHSAQHLYITGR